MNPYSKCCFSFYYADTCALKQLYSPNSSIRKSKQGQGIHMVGFFQNFCIGLINGDYFIEIILFLDFNFFVSRLPLAGMESGSTLGPYNSGDQAQIFCNQKIYSSALIYLCSPRVMFLQGMSKSQCGSQEFSAFLGQTYYQFSVSSLQ